jgi:acetyl esterase/lipase
MRALIAAGVVAGLVVVASAGARGLVVAERDVSYGADPLQKLDFFAPSARNFPTVIFVHGGSLAGGDKSDGDYGRVCNPFPAAGIACASVNYRLLPAAAWPAQPEDVATAIAWVRSHVVESGGDPDRLFLLGHSSGAMLVALVGSDAHYLAAQKLTTATIRGVIPMGSIMWDDDLRQSIEKNGRDRVATAFANDPRGKAFGSLDGYQSQWPINYVRNGLPPYLFLIAEAEQINPPVLKTNEQFAADSRARGNQAAVRVFPGRTHYSMIRYLDRPGDEVCQAVVEFIQRGR